MEYSYSDPAGFIEEITFSQRSGITNYASKLVFEEEIITMFSEQGYLMQAGFLPRVRVHPTFQKIDRPNPKRGYTAITTFPPVYQSRGEQAPTIVVPRVYPPIFISPKGRGRNR